MWWRRGGLALAAASALMAVGPSVASADEIDIVHVGGRSGALVEGYLPPGGAAPAPLDVPYPDADPALWEHYPKSTNLFRAETVPGGEELHLYCIQIETQRHENYTSVEWDAGVSPNLGHIARILHSYFPAVDAPPGVQDGPKITVVQAAIWYFTDGFVLAEDDEYHDAVEAIVNDTLDAGPLDEESVDLTFGFDGPTATIPTGTIAGPFVTSAGVPGVTFTVEASGATVYTDPDGVTEIPPGTVLTVGTPVWVRGNSPGPVVMNAEAQVPVPASLLFRETNPNPLIGEGQMLVSATTTFETAAASIELTFEGQLATTTTQAPTTTGPDASTTVPASSTSTSSTSTSSVGTTDPRPTQPQTTMPPPRGTLPATGSSGATPTALAATLLLLAGAVLVFHARRTTLRR